VNEQEWLADRFEVDRPRLCAVAYRMLGSLSEADDAVQQAWLRLSRSDASGIENLSAWLTTVVGRVCLDMLRSRKARREEPLAGRLPDLLVDRVDGIDPEAARQFASRARRRVRAERTEPGADLETQREVGDAFLAAARDGDFDRLVALLDPDVVPRADFGPDGGSQELRGAAAVAGQALGYPQIGLDVRPALINGGAGAVAFRHGQPFSIGAITVRNGRIVELDFLTDPKRLRELDLTLLD
jgi:RNA polymerase sigma-70 factor (ECF subfamily)